MFIRFQHAAGVPGDSLSARAPGREINAGAVMSEQFVDISPFIENF